MTYYAQRLSTEEIQALPAVLTTKEASGILGVQPGTLLYWANEGHIPATKVGSRWRFNKTTICEIVGLKQLVESVVDKATTHA